MPSRPADPLAGSIPREPGSEAAVPRSPKSLLAAGRLLLREDRLTDFVAVAAERNLDFARALLSLGGLNHSVTRVDVSTQAWTPRGRRVDFELIGLNEDRVVCRLWSEHKTGATYQDLQLEDYAQDLATMPNSALLTVVEHPRDAPKAPDGEWTVATWADVAARALGVVRAGLGGDWRRHVWRPDIPARTLVLAELLSYLDQEHHIVSDPLTSTDLVAFANAARAFNTLDSLMARAAQLSDEPVSEEVGWDVDEGAAWVILDTRDEDWWTGYGGCPEIHLADEDTYFGARRVGEPAIGLGINLPPGYGDTVFATHLDWVRQLREEGLDPYPDDDWLRIYRSVYLAQILAAGVTLEEQARFVAEQMRRVLITLRALAPGQRLTLPPKRGPRRRDTTEESDRPD